MSRRSASPPVGPLEGDRSPAVTWLLQAGALLNATAGDLASFGGPGFPEGAALDLLHSAALSRLEQLAALPAPPEMADLQDGLRQQLECWRDALAALQAGNPARAIALVHKFRREAGQITRLIQSCLPPAGLPAKGSDYVQ